jgi:glycosyltransferase involved in cell wall biosynthesis
MRSADCIAAAFAVRGRRPAAMRGARDRHDGHGPFIEGYRLGPGGIASTMIELSVIVSAHNLRRELPRTIRSLSPPYQTGVDPARMEIIVVDNGSDEPVERDWFEQVAADVRILRFAPGNKSPCRALNEGAAAARGSLIAVLIDGARMASPGLLALSRTALRIAGDVFVATLGFHLGYETQQVSIANGYGPEAEDALLRDIDWPDDGYRLFEICARGESYRDGVFSAFPETTACVMHRASFERVGGFDDRFRYRGGGLANFDFFERVLSDRAITPVVLIGEGTFHQVHYGNSTRAGGVRARETPEGPTIWDAMAQEFVGIVGHDPISVKLRTPLLFGSCSTAAIERCFFPRAATA